MILIVDDKKENIIPLRKILELHSIESDAAESGEEALLKTLKNEYSLIIMDVQMPGMDGFEVAETLSGSKRTKDIPVLFLSAISKEKKYISRGYASGAVDYITKPVDPDLLMLKVKTFLKLYQQQKELKDTRDLLSNEIEIRKTAQHELMQANENLESKVAERTRELISKNKELEFSNHELQQFAWVASHDLKEPLRKIEIFIRIIQEKYLIDDTVANDYINRTIRSAERMRKLITDLLEYSRLSADVVFEKADLNEILGEVLADFDYTIEQKKAIIESDKMPTINGIPGQLRQVFQNILSNSLKFAKTDVPPVITIESQRIVTRNFKSPADSDGKFCRITVTDNGIGFDENYLDKIFRIFQSLNDRNTYEGTGIGLAIVKKIIEKHNGLITAESQPDKGSRFIIILPI
jgi:signal transduction histidine kinase